MSLFNLLIFYQQVRKGNIVLDKFGSFRLAQEGETPVSVGDGRPEQFVTRIKPPSPSGRRPRSPPSPRRRSSNSSEDDRRSPRKSRSRYVAGCVVVVERNKW